MLILRPVLLLLPEIIRVHVLRNGRGLSGGYVGGLEVAIGRHCLSSHIITERKLKIKHIRIVTWSKSENAYNFQTSKSYHFNGLFLQS